jgi:Rrf2 family protein
MGATDHAWSARGCGTPTAADRLARVSFLSTALQAAGAAANYQINRSFIRLSLSAWKGSTSRPMILSKACEYGIRVVLLLAAQDAGPAYHPVKTLARRCGSPHYFLSKICGKLTRDGILISYKGPNGGVALARPLDEITLMHVVESIDGRERFDPCVLGLEPCSPTAPCPLHEEWTGIKQAILSMLEKRHLQDLVDDLASGKTMLKRLLSRQLAGSATE